MQKRKKIFTIILALMLITAMTLYWQNNNSKMMLADVSSSNGARYSVELPKNFAPANFNDTLPEMSLQYENADRGLHILVIDESKAKIISFGLDYDLDTYMKIATRAQDKDGVYVNKPAMINDNKALQTEIKETTNGKKQVYKLTCIETQKFFYQVLIWSDEDKYESNKEEMDKMINSFKEKGTGDPSTSSGQAKGQRTKKKLLNNFVPFSLHKQKLIFRIHGQNSNSLG